MKILKKEADEGSREGVATLWQLQKFSLHLLSTLFITNFKLFIIDEILITVAECN